MRKTLLYIFVILMLATISFSGCVARETSPEPITITFTFPDSPDWERYQALADEFQKSHPSIFIDLIPSPRGKIIRDLDRGVDAFIWWPDPSLSTGENPVIQSIEPLLNQTGWENDFYPRSVEMFRWDGRLWALPAEIDMQLLYFNQEYFDEEGVAYPQTGWAWEDLLSTAQSMTTVSGQVRPTTGYYGLVTNPRWGDVIPFIYQHGGDVFGWDDPRLAEALQWYADLSRVYGVVPQPKYVDYGDTYGFFREQKAAMWIGFMADRDGFGFHHLASPWPFEWGVVPLPGGMEAEGTLYRVQGYYITSHCEHVDEAWAWIQFLSSHPVGKALPARQAIAESENFQALAGEEVADSTLHAVEYLIPRVTAQGYHPEMLEMYAHTVESVVNDGYRIGFFKSPAYARRLSILMEAVMKGEITAVEAVEKLKLEFGE